MSSIQDFTLAWPIPDLDLLVEQLHHRHRRGGATVDADDRERAPRRTEAMAVWRAEVRSLPTFSISALATTAGERLAIFCTSSWTGAP
jgi:hypothetical protein